MKQQSLRQLAKELGVSASYLSQIRHGKRRASEKVLSMLSSVKQAKDKTVDTIAPVDYGCYNAFKSHSVTLGIRLVVGQRTLDSLNSYEPLSRFLSSRRQGLSDRTLRFYKGYMTRALSVLGIEGTPVTSQDISQFLNTLECSNGGKHAYYRTLRAFYNWLYSPKSGYGLNPQDNPILMVDAPKVEKRILPALTDNQVAILIDSADNPRDKCIVSLLADSGMRLNELATMPFSEINWDNRTVTIWGKGNKQRKAPFTERTTQLLRNLNGSGNGSGFGLSYFGVQKMLKRLSIETGIKCNAHSFRRGFACNLHKKGLSTLDIMHLGGWADLSMVLRYTRSITFDDCLKHYQNLDA